MKIHINLLVMFFACSIFAAQKHNPLPIVSQYQIHQKTKYASLSDMIENKEIFSSTMSNKKTLFIDPTQQELFYINSKDVYTPSKVYPDINNIKKKTSFTDIQSNITHYPLAYCILDPMTFKPTHNTFDSETLKFLKLLAYSVPQTHYYIKTNGSSNHSELYAKIKSIYDETHNEKNNEFNRSQKQQKALFSKLLETITTIFKKIIDPKVLVVICNTPCPRPEWNEPIKYCSAALFIARILLSYII